MTMKEAEHETIEKVTKNASFFLVEGQTFFNDLNYSYASDNKP